LTLRIRPATSLKAWRAEICRRILRADDYRDTPIAAARRMVASSERRMRLLRVRDAQENDLFVVAPRRVLLDVADAGDIALSPWRSVNVFRDPLL
jgi:hypothetical protein